MAQIDFDKLPGREGRLLSSGRKYVIRKVILKGEDGTDRSEVEVSFEKAFGGWEKYNTRLPIQTLREASVCNPFGDDYERPGEIPVHGTADDGKDKLDGQSAAPHGTVGGGYVSPFAFPQYVEGDWI